MHKAPVVSLTQLGSQKSDNSEQNHDDINCVVFRGCLFVIHRDCSRNHRAIVNSQLADSKLGEVGSVT